MGHSQIFMSSSLMSPAFVKNKLAPQLLSVLMMQRLMLLPRFSSSTRSQHLGKKSSRRQEGEEHVSSSENRSSDRGKRQLQEHLSEDQDQTASTQPSTKHDGTEYDKSKGSPFYQAGPIMSSLLQNVYYSMKKKKDSRQVANTSNNNKHQQIAERAKSRFSDSAAARCESFQNDESGNAKLYPLSRNLKCKDTQLNSASISISEGLEGMFLSEEKTGNETIAETKQLLSRAMVQKYQFPEEKEAENLRAMFPDYRQLVFNVLGRLEDAGVTVDFAPSLSSHLGARYWKASMLLVWPHRLTITGSHPMKAEAVDRAYLLTCQTLKDLGLVYKTDGHWQPVTHDMVISWLDVVAEYGSEAAGVARGRGFKLVLEGPTSSQDDGVEDSSGPCLESGSLKSLMERCVIGEDKSDRGGVGTSVKKVPVDSDSFHEHLDERSSKSSNSTYCGYHNRPYDDFSEDRVFSDTPSIPEKPHKRRSLTEIPSSSSSSTLQERLSGESVSEREPEERPQVTAKKWQCKVHVGWPVPFTVHAVAPSLPAAQMLGLWGVANKFKNNHLLSSNTGTLSVAALERRVLLGAYREWEKSQICSRYNLLAADFLPDAEIFCDASNIGFGAYLVHKDVSKVSWLSEAWSSHSNILPQLRVVGYNRKHIVSTLAEVFAVVNAVFTWKKKLKNSKLLVFSDSSTAVSILNTFQTISLAKCDSHYVKFAQIYQHTCSDYSITAQCVWVERERNQFADCLARQKHKEFKNMYPLASKFQTKAKKLHFKY